MKVFFSWKRMMVFRTNILFEQRTSLFKIYTISLMSILVIKCLGLPGWEIWRENTWREKEDTFGIQTNLTFTKPSHYESSQFDKCCSERKEHHPRSENVGSLSVQNIQFFLILNILPRLATAESIQIESVQRHFLSFDLRRLIFNRILQDISTS